MVMKEGHKKKINQKQPSLRLWGSTQRRKRTCWRHIGDMLGCVKGYLEMFVKKITRPPEEIF